MNKTLDELFDEGIRRWETIYKQRFKDNHIREIHNEIIQNIDYIIQKSARCVWATETAGDY